MTAQLALVLLTVSVLFGGLLVTILERSKNMRIIKLMLAFSGGFLLSIAFTHFIPELYESSDLNVGIYILVGFLVQLLLEFFSGGIEHGHIHAHKNAKVPVAMVVALSIHSLLEGIPLGAQYVGIEIATSHHHSGESALLLGILLHQIPVGIALMTLLSVSPLSSMKSWGVLTLFALMSPIGMLIGMAQWSFMATINSDAILAIVVGMFLHISTTIIFETSENHKFNFIKLVTIFGGCALAFIIH